MALSLNVDAVHAATTLYQDESVRDGLVAVAEEVGAIECTETSTGAAEDDAAGDDADADATDTDDEGATDTDGADDDGDAGAVETETTKELDLECLRSELGDSLALPIGWDDIDTSFGDWVLRALGWLFVATAVTLGAPFWFDLLGRALAKKRGTSTS
ncbi:MAG: hypothetical protein QNJ12_17135 [Ilumatobacter sp.]|uniref:hypothetical protein n=1 Tax=Ilumatobacter sp. TaxID=1967498 RepID=UPI002603D0A5|nr:hypothetical protein [Ilumatobacter sp.]MDJ0770521.1 hypothetical protein [Ilumatobacter sp.]